MRKGIILSGGLGTRLYPLIFSVIKQLLPVYDKPMIYYPLSTLLSFGIKDILIISTPKDCPNIETLFKDGSDFGINIQYKVQEKPNGIAESLILAEDFLCGSPCALILGDNLFLGDLLDQSEASKIINNSETIVFSTEVSNPERYGVIVFDSNNDPIEIIEKPKFTNSKSVITGLYFYDSNATKIAKKLKASPRGELEITDLNNYYLKNSILKVINLKKSCVWLDAGTFDTLSDAAQIVKGMEKRSGQKFGCFEEICFNLGYINEDKLKKIINRYHTSDYGYYLKRFLKS